MLVRVEGRRAQTHPIAGTRKRGTTAEEDQRMADELKRNEKERAEHVMLVDLGRNDLGRVCDFGTVRVPTYMALERYSHVMHLVSVVDGTLAEVLDEVVGERIVVVDDEHHYDSPRCASSSARITARALSRVSSYSAVGFESATMPAPACT